MTELSCPKCHQDNLSMIETRNQRRESMECACNVCGHVWIQVFEGIPRETVPLPVDDKKLTEKKK